MRRFCRLAATVAPVVGALFLFGSPPARAQIVCVNCADIVTQALQLAQEAGSLAEQIRMYQIMLQNTQTLSSFSWNDTVTDIMKIRSLMNSAMMLGGQAQDFTASLNSESALSGRLATLDEFNAQYQQWATVTSDDISHMQASIGIQETQRASDATTLAALQRQSQSAAGQMQAIQAGNEMAALGVSQTQKLQAMLAQETQLVVDQTGIREERQAASDSALQEFLENPLPALSGNGHGYR